MTISVGFLEIGELGSDLEISLLKTMLITGSALFFMALVGFNTAFAPTINGVIGNPLYTGLFLGGSSTNVSGLLTGAWWSQQSTGLTIGTYFLFETAYASASALEASSRSTMKPWWLYSRPSSPQPLLSSQ